ncbi:MAG TPA: hypothetical protein VER79_13405 [Candidatus Limnocylindrales bacterium]|nr:hypothetical protein [Candidatus Limnocylindrales bacterium]
MLNRKGSRTALAGTLMAMLVAGCTGESATAVPTLTLIPSTATATVAPAAPTASPQSLTSPQDLETTAPQMTGTPGGTLLEIDPVAAELAALAQRLLGEQLDLPVRRVRVIDVQAVVWPDGSLGCPQPDQMYTQALINGYRIVLEAAGERTIFHTDFDRAFVCPSENEQLPDGFVPVAEATEEATQESP